MTLGQPTARLTCAESILSALALTSGGTFTDLTLFDTTTGHIVGHKTPTLTANPAQGLRRGLGELAVAANIDVGQIEYFAH